jgi:hypothetical protein
MFDPFSRSYSPISATPYGEADPKRVGVTKMDPIFEHFCTVCGAGASFGFGGDFAAGVPGVWSCAAHRDQVEKRWKRG